MLLTTRLGGETFAASPASHFDRASLSGGCAQKNECEYSSCTVLPFNHAFVNPMLRQLGPPLWHGRVLATLGPEAEAAANVRPKIAAAVVMKITPVRNGPTRDHLVIAALLWRIGFGCPPADAKVRLPHHLLSWQPCVTGRLDPGLLW
jgi:hypothetical protein